jgi:hypothetical protein
MMLLTLAFFENPAAKAHIKFWEDSLQHRIQSRIDYPSGSVGYYVRKDSDFEIVYCVPINSDLTTILEDLKTCLGQIKYYKTLIFGRVEIEDLNRIKEIIDYCSSHL